MDEQALIGLYMELTGKTEAAARNVFMMLPEEAVEACAPAAQPYSNEHTNGDSERRTFDRSAAEEKPSRRA